MSFIIIKRKQKDNLIAPQPETAIKDVNVFDDISEAVHDQSTFKHKFK